jgi:nucleotide-binding universal stress UspA family protein
MSQPPSHAIRRILVPVDFSPASRAALEYAVFLARRFDAGVEVLHVWEPPLYVGPEITITAPGRAVTLAEFARTEASRGMEEFLASLDRAGLPSLNGRVDSGPPAATILRVATDEHCDLIVMGTRGRTGLAHALLGSVAEKVVRRASCPVVTVHAPDGKPALVDEAQ